MHPMPGTVQSDSSFAGSGSQQVFPETSCTRKHLSKLVANATQPVTCLSFS